MLVFNDLEWIRDTDKDKTILVKTLSQERRASGDALCVRFCPSRFVKTIELTFKWLAQNQLDVLAFCWRIFVTFN